MNQCGKALSDSGCYWLNSDYYSKFKLALYTYIQNFNISRIKIDKIRRVLILTTKNVKVTGLYFKSM